MDERKSFSCEMRVILKLSWLNFLVQVTQVFSEIKDHLNTSNKFVIKNFNKQIFTTVQANFLRVLHIGIGNHLHRKVSVVQLRVK